MTLRSPQGTCVPNYNISQATKTKYLNKMASLQKARSLLRNGVPPNELTSALCVQATKECRVDWNLVSNVAELAFASSDKTFHHAVVAAMTWLVSTVVFSRSKKDQASQGGGGGGGGASLVKQASLEHQGGASSKQESVLVPLQEPRLARLARLAHNDVLSERGLADSAGPYKDALRRRYDAYEGDVWRYTTPKRGFGQGGWFEESVRRSVWWRKGLETTKYGGKYGVDKEPQGLTVEASFRAYAELTSKGWLSSLPYTSVVPLCALSLVMPGIMKQHRVVKLLLGYMFGEFGTKVAKTELEESCVKVHLSLNDATTVSALDVQSIAKFPACLSKDGMVYLFKRTDQLCVYMASLWEVHDVKEHVLLAKLPTCHALKHTKLCGTTLSATCGATLFEVDIETRQVATF